jgi:dihydrolipoamide dehydrogenase
MVTEIIMPKNGMDMKEGTLLRWLKNVGDRVERDEPIMEIETDKVTMESESPADGILLAKYYEEGAVVPVLTVIGHIGAEGEEAPGLGKNVGSAAPPLQNAAEPKADRNVPSFHEKKYDFDVAVIGGGPAGYVAAIRAAQLGGRAALFERDTVGGTCLNRGCIPTKTYLKTAEYLRYIRNASERGILSDPNASVDMKKVVAHKNKIVKKLTSGVASLLKSQSVRVERGEASLAGKREITCGGNSFTAANIILCGGSKSAAPPIPGSDHLAVLNSDGILSIEEIPRRLCIIGGGVIGCEIACAFAEFGCEVTLLEALPRLVANMDASVSQALKNALSASGVKILLGEPVKGIEDNHGKPTVVAGSARIDADYALIATGREADISCLGIMEGEIKKERGKISVNERMETNVSGIFAAGDITGGFMLAHAAFKMAEAAAANAMGGSVSCQLRYVPYCVYTLPEAAGAGMSEEAARAAYGDAITVGNFPLLANGRSLASGESAGFVKVIINKLYGEILGTHIVGSAAAEMIAEPAALMSMEVTAHEVVETIVHAHPTFTEAFMEACADALGRCVHLPKR